jgi:hypothetical protein
VLLIWFGARLMQRTSVSASDARPSGDTAQVSSGSTSSYGGFGFASSSLDPTADRIYGVAILSGVKRLSTSSHFRGGELTAFMGGGQIDLRGATIPPGEEAVLDLFCVMGGFELIVPQNWVIMTPVIPIMGGIDDKRLAPPPGSSDVAGQSAPRLSLRGFILMGGLTIRS